MSTRGATRAIALSIIEAIGALAAFHIAFT